MKLCLHRNEHIQIANDSELGFVVYVGQGVIHIRAKTLDDPEPTKTSAVIDAAVEITK